VRPTKVRRPAERGDAPAGPGKLSVADVIANKTKTRVGQPLKVLSDPTLMPSGTRGSRSNSGRLQFRGTRLSIFKLGPSLRFANLPCDGAPFMKGTA
jgi:hypothetical protein